jgi:hypothetical protein
MSLTQCKQCTEWCQGEFWSDSLMKLYPDHTPSGVHSPPLSPLSVQQMSAAEPNPRHITYVQTGTLEKNQNIKNALHYNKY